mmetsp:Transcript_125676/g.280792  ORF Transcript_125676/g.280792 Transcript_125676/m.280792 type:complete len:263 (+) Transcript_125676:1390-2178(+)
MPASRHNSANIAAVVGVNSEGLITTLLPMTSAGANFQVSKYNGKFHGVMIPTTPMGFLKEKLIDSIGPADICRMSPPTCKARPAKKRKFATLLGTSKVFARAKGFPVSRDSARAKVSAEASRSSANRERAAQRASRGVRRHSEPSATALAAAATAAATSSALLQATSPSSSPVSGRTKLRPVPGHRTAPSTTFGTRRAGGSGAAASQDPSSEALRAPTREQAARIPRVGARRLPPPTAERATLECWSRRPTSALRRIAGAGA